MNNQEIGGYLELEHLISRPYYPHLKKINTGRHALLYVLKAKKIHTLHLPSYLCDSVSAVCEQNEIKTREYAVDGDFLPVIDKPPAAGEALLLVNYYGQLTDELIFEYKKKWDRIIVDHTQAFFQKPLLGVDTFYSCRKFFGVPDGAYLYTDKQITEELERDVSKERMKHLLGRYEGRAFDYYQDFQDHERFFRQESLKKMSLLTENLLGAVNYGWVKMVREENFQILYEALQVKNRLKLRKPIGPFAYPFYFTKGEEVRRELARRHIYIPTLWPNVVKDLTQDRLETDYAKHILPLPCDQRYAAKDMEKLIAALQEFL